MSDDEDDYMSTKYLEDTAPKRSETYSERRRRRELEERSHIKPRRELERERREEGLARPLLGGEGGDSAKESPGVRMMLKMGYSPGKTLGKTGDVGLTEPIRVEVKEDRWGIGKASEVRKRAREAEESAAKRTRIEDEEYRDRVRDEHQQRRTERRLHAMRQMCERLDAEKGINETVYWLTREDDDDDQRLDHTESPDREIDVDDKGKEGDEDLQPCIKERRDAFERLKPSEQLAEVLRYLRSEYAYCLWCGQQYVDAGELAANCPGEDEDDH